MKAKALRMSDRDNVATAISDLSIGEKVLVEDGKKMEITLLAAVQFGHKFAVRPIKKGDDIIKYGETIGRATVDIAKGEHVHVHNIESLRGRGDISVAEAKQ